jgi:predicted nuclease of predicted toxin-antitoxin system
MRFVLDENVPVAVADMLVGHGHTAEFIRDHVPPGAVDPLVATVAEELNAILISFDGDFQKKIAPRIPDGQKPRFRRLSRIWMRCGEPEAAARLESAIVLVESELALAQLRADSRMMMQVGKSYIRTDR